MICRKRGRNPILAFRLTIRHNFVFHWGACLLLCLPLVLWRRILELGLCKVSPEVIVNTNLAELLRINWKEDQILSRSFTAVSHNTMAPNWPTHWRKFWRKE